jgi:acetoin utilization protein AcuC
MKPVAVVYNKCVVGYDFGRGHPFRGDRFPKFIKLAEEKGLFCDPQVLLIEQKPATEDEIALIHPIEYIREVERREKLYLPLSADTPLQPGIVDAAKLIIGASLKAGELVAENSVSIAEGVGGGLHHAGKTYGGGFCVFNDVAICAQTFVDSYDLERILILDSDVHAGNGTMDIFYDDPQILFISVHQDPTTIYPGTGFIEQVGKGKGEGFTVNVPLPMGADDRCMALFLEEIFKPLSKEFRPQAIIRNGGSDPHHMDGLGGLNITFRGLYSIGRAVAEAAKKSGCGIVDLCCSGYNPLTVADGWFSLLTGAMGKALQMNEYSPPPSSPDSIIRKTVQVVENVKTTLNEYWDIF